MTLEIPQRLRKGLPAYLVHAAERVPLEEIDRDLRVAKLLEQRTAADARHRDYVHRITEQREILAQAQDRLVQAKNELSRLDAAFPGLAVRFAEGTVTDDDLNAHHRARASWEAKKGALQVGITTLEQNVSTGMRLNSSGAAVTDLDVQIEEARAEIAIEWARRSA